MASTVATESSQSMIEVIADIEEHVGDAGRVGRADIVLAVDRQFDMQAVAAEQHRRRCSSIALVAGELVRLRQADAAPVLERDGQVAALERVCGGIRVRPVLERRDLVEECARPGDHALAAHRVVGPRLRCVAEDVRSVDGVVEGPPAGVGCIERIAGVCHRHHELWAGQVSDLLVDVIRFDREIGPLRLEVPDLLEVRAVRGRVEVVAAVLAMPAIEGVLQLLAAVEQRTVP